MIDHEKTVSELKNIEYDRTITLEVSTNSNAFRGGEEDSLLSLKKMIEGKAAIASSRSILDACPSKVRKYPMDFSNVWSVKVDPKVNNIWFTDEKQNTISRYNKALGFDMYKIPERSSTSGTISPVSLDFVKTSRTAGYIGGQIVLEKEQ